MDFVKKFLVLIILNSYAFLFADGEELAISRSNNTKSSVEKTDRNLYGRLCTRSCGSNMMCDDNKCMCIDNYKWDKDKGKCMRKCSYNSDCATNGHCDDGNY
jgi:hypothetical protein